MQLEDRTTTCPYCWQEIALELDLSVDAQSYTEDCSVCCRPLWIRYEVDADGCVQLEVRAEAE
jgi:hypothetical protein